MKSFIKYWVPLLIWIGIMFAGSTELLSAEQTSRFLLPFLRWLNPDVSAMTLAQIHFFMRKLGHVTEYAILAALLWRALRRGSHLRPKRSIVFTLVLAGCVVFAASDEFHQSFVPSRTAALCDVLIDLCGAFLGMAICWALSHRTRARLEGN